MLGTRRVAGSGRRPGRPRPLGLRRPSARRGGLGAVALLGGRWSASAAVAFDQAPARHERPDDLAQAQVEGEHQPDHDHREQHDERAGPRQERLEEALEEPPDPPAACERGAPDQDLADAEDPGIEQADAQERQPPARSGARPLEVPAGGEQQERQQPAHGPEPRRERVGHQLVSAPWPGSSSAMSVIAPRISSVIPMIERTTSGVNWLAEARARVRRRLRAPASWCGWRVALARGQR